MPYKKTKDGSLVNEVTLGDGYPLSNDLQPLKIGGEASILGISSPLPDGSDSGLFRVDGDLDITGTLKTKLSHDLIYDFDDEVNTLAQAKIDALVDSAPAALDTLNELAAALGDDASFATTVTNSIATKLPLAGGDMTGHLQVTASDGNHSGSGAYVPTGSDWQDVLRLGSTGTNGLNFIVNDGGTMKATYWTGRWGAQHEWARNSNPSSPDSNVYQPIARLTGNDTDQYFRLFAGTSNAIPVNIQAEGSTDTYFNNSSNNVAIGSTSAGGYKLQVTGTANITSDLTVDTSTLKVDSSNNRVGIGTTSPDSNLHIKSSSATQPVLQLETALDGGGADTFVRFGDSTEDYSYALGIDDSSNTFRLAYNGSSYNGAVLGTNDLLTVTTAGNVGIGTTSPSVLTHISADGSSTLPTFGAETRLAVTQTGNTGGYNAMTVLGGHSTGASIYKFGDKDDEDVGKFIYYHEHNRLDTFVNGSQAMSIDSSGNVGIGTASPIAPLHIESTINALADTDEPENCHLLLRNAANDTNEGVGIGFLISAQTDDIGSSIVYKRTGSNAKGELRFNVKTNTTDDGVISQAMVIDDSANVGIGTDSPSNPLEVVAGENKGICVNRNATTEDSPVEVGFRHTTSDGDATTGIRSYRTNEDDSNDQELRFFTMAGSGGEGEHLTIKHNGKIGIGTTSPTTTLDVEGTVSYKAIGLTSSTDALDVSDTTIVSANSTSGNIILGGFANGVSGQIIHVIHTRPTNSLKFEHNEATGTQPIFTSTSADKTLSGYGGMTLFCNGTRWFEIGN